MYLIPRRMFITGTAGTASACSRLTSKIAVNIEPMQPYIKLCKDCKYFVPAQEKSEDLALAVKTGVCKRITELDLVDGTIVYHPARYIRMNKCKGELWERSDTTDTSEL